MTAPSPAQPDESADDPQLKARLFHEGVELFNDGQWFEAHEVWEDLWHLSSGATKSFIQGLIQAAVALEHFRRGNPRGVRSVYATAVPKFAGLPPVYFGVDIARLLADLERCLRPLLNLPASHFEPQSGRSQSLPVALQDPPRIQLQYDPFAGDQAN